MKRSTLWIIFLVLGSILTWWPHSEFGDVLTVLPSPGPCPTGLVWADGTLWLLDRNRQELTAIDPKTGNTLRSMPTPGFFPTGIAWDGHFLWISDICTGDDCTGQIFQVDPKNGDVMRTLVSPVPWPVGLCWDNGALWILDDRRNKLIKIDPTDGTILAEYLSPHTNPTGAAFDGKYLWIGDRGKDRIYLVDPGTGEVIFDIEAPGPYVWGVAWDGDTLWCVDYQTQKIYQIKAKDSIPYTMTQARKEHVRVSSEIRTRGKGEVLEGSVCFAIPVESPSQKFVTPIKYSLEPTETPSDKWGQKVALFRYKGLKAGESLRFSWEADVELNGMRWKIYPDLVGPASDIPEEVGRLYLEDSIKYDIHNPYIRKVVKKVVGDESNLYWKARKLYNFVIHALEYQRTGGWETAPIVLQRGSGSCSEYTFSYIALCRAAGIPARYVGAVVVRGDDASLDWVYHRWGEIYLPGYGWIPIDANHGDKPLPADRANGFGTLDNRYVITTKCGGFSQFLEWNYNAFNQQKTTSRCRVSSDTIAEWSPR